jgi:hypothetical protein
VTVDAEAVRAELERACADAGLAAGGIVAWIVDATCPDGATPVAYLHPPGRVRDDTVRVFRAVGTARAAAYEGVHRLALWRELPRFPAAALGPMLRHELEHALRWQRSGTAFYEADERLRRSVDATAYADLPTEREANAAAGAYARRVLSPSQLEELELVPELAHLLSAAPPSDVVESTFALLGSRVEVALETVPAAVGVPVVELVRAKPS